MSRYLGDTSVLVRLHHQDVLQRVGALYLNGRIATCGIVDLELLFGARTAADHAGLLEDRRVLPRVPCGDEAADRALEVQGRLARAGHHRDVPVQLLLVAAAAEQAGCTVLHHDARFERIAAVTGQPVEWVVPPGTVP